MTGLKDTPPYFRDADRRTLLQNNYLFSKLSPRHIDRLAACVVGKSIPRATGIFARGDPGSSLFAICQATVKISVPSFNAHNALSNIMPTAPTSWEITLPHRRPLPP